jgi:GT2 family glycosyltransferase
MKRDLRIAAYLGVKDEIELIERSIAHLRAIGVDTIMACDMSSTDGTAEVLEKYRSDDFLILTLCNNALSGRAEEEDSWMSHSLRRYKDAPADWVIFLDADEFWLPASGNLKDCEGFYSADVLVVDRFNVVLGPRHPCMPFELPPSRYGETQLFVRTVRNFHIAKQTDATATPWIMGQLMPKIAARPSMIDGTIAGEHDVIAYEGSLRRTTPNDLLIAHLGLSTRSRFERKVRNIRAIYDGEGIDLSLPEETWRNYGVGWHWRRWATLPDLSDEFAQNVVSDEQISILREQGVIASAQEMLERRAPWLQQAHRFKTSLLLELEYGSTFRPSDTIESVDRRLLAVRFIEIGVFSAATEDSLGQFDFRVQPASGWQAIYGLSHFEPPGVWSLGRSTAIFFTLAKPLAGPLRIEIAHEVADHILPRVQAKLRINKGPWRFAEFIGGVCAIDFDEQSTFFCHNNVSLGIGTRPTLSIIVINYERPDLTFAAVTTILSAQIRDPYEIIVVDNGSSAFLTKTLTEMELPVRLLHLRNQSSFGTANNIAAEAARGEFLMLLNNDTFLNEGVVEALLEELCAEGVGLVGPIFRYPDNSLQEIGGFVSVDGSTATPLFNGFGWDAPRVADVDYISAACVMLRRADFLGVGGFDPEFELAYSEDVDLCFRLRALGKCSHLVSSASVRHIRGATSSRPEDSTKIDNLKLRNLNVLRSRWGGVAAARQDSRDAPVNYGFEVPRLEHQIARFPEQQLHCVTSRHQLTGDSDANATLAHAAALGCLGPTMVSAPSAYAVIDICDRAHALGLAHESLTTGGRDQLQRREIEVALVSDAAFPPASASEYGARRILHCPFPKRLNDAEFEAHRRRIGILLNFDAIVTDSEFSRRACVELLDRLGAPPVDIEVISGPVDVFAVDERQGARANIVVSMGPLRDGPSGGGHDAALRAFTKFSSARSDQNWRLAIVGNLSPDDDARYVDMLRSAQPQLDIDVLVNPPRSILRRLLARSKVYLSAQGHDAKSPGDVWAFPHSIAQVGTAISAGCIPVVFHIGAEAEFCEAQNVGYVFRDESELSAALLQAADLAGADGLTAAQCAKMDAFSRAVHSQAWAHLISRLRAEQESETTNGPLPALVVAGCHRSGTSAMARALSLAGADLPSSVMVAAPDNPSGFWEPAGLDELNEEMLGSKESSWDDAFALFSRSRLEEPEDVDLHLRKAIALLGANYVGNRPIVVKDPRISILTNTWDMALRSLHYQPKYIIMVRDPREVAASLAERNGFSTGKGLLIWASYMLSIEKNTRTKQRVFVAYPDLIANPKTALDRIASSLRIAFRRKGRTEQRVAAFVNPRQRHYNYDVAWSSRLTEAINDYFCALLAASRDKPLSETPGQSLESWLTEFLALLKPGSLDL